MLPLIRMTAKRLPYLRRLLIQRDQLLAERAQLQVVNEQLLAELDSLRQGQQFPPGHYYSPIPCLEEVKRREGSIWQGPPRAEIPGVNLNTDAQLAFSDELARYYADQPFGRTKTAQRRYFLDNQWFDFTDGLVLYAMIRHLKPRRIIEVGSGFSSAAILDTNDLFFNGAIQCTFIEPEPTRLLSLLSEGDQRQHIILPRPIQDIDVALFETLEANDFLFVDSSHVAKVGSDVNQIVFQLLPVLRRGVYVHFHDVFWPFEYPPGWVYQGRAWNEDYLVRAFLQYNSAFVIRLFSQYLSTYYEERFRGAMPWGTESPGCSLWLEKVSE